MERNSPGAFGARPLSGTFKFGAGGQRHLGSLASCDSLTGKLLALVHYLRLLQVVRHGAAAEVTTRPPSPAAPAPLPLFPACDSESVAVRVTATVTVLRQAMRVCSRAAVLPGLKAALRPQHLWRRGLRPHRRLRRLSARPSAALYVIRLHSPATTPLPVPRAMPVNGRGLHE